MDIILKLLLSIFLEEFLFSQEMFQQSDFDNFDTRKELSPSFGSNSCYMLRKI